MKYIFTAIFAIFALFSTICSANDLYKISNLKSTSNQNDLKMAREEASFKAKKQAFKLLLTRFEVDDSDEFVDSLNKNTIDKFVTNIAITNENLTNNLYESFIDVEFSKRKISSLISNNSAQDNDSLTSEAFKNAKVVSLNVPVKGLNYWQEIKAKLQRADMLRYTNTRYLTSNFVLLELNVDGLDVQNLLAKLYEQNLRIAKRRDNLYLLQF